jgi:flagellar L-ring protein precursor FlgH
MARFNLTRRSSFRSDLALLGALAFLLAAAPAGAGSLWKKDASRSMFADRRATQVGDIITILVQENNTSSKQNTTKTARANSVDASISSFLYPPSATGMLKHNGELPALRYNAATDFSGGGQINNSERITARIAARVVDVLPNGHLVIEGRRHIAFSGEKQEAVLRGTVRQEDITSGNTIFSYHVADATIQYISAGTISDVQRKGWFTRLWEKLSPF